MAVKTNSDPIIFGTNNSDTITALSDGANIYGYGGNDDYFINAHFYHSIVSGLPDIPADIIHEEVGGGIDTVHVSMYGTLDGASSNSYGNYVYVLDDNVENLIADLSIGGGLTYSSFTLVGNDVANNITVGTGTSSTWASISGFGGNDSLTGGLGDDSLYGGLGNDTLIGGLGDDSLDGGLGNDSMVGGVGDDFYIVDSTLDKAIEGAGAGIDTVNSLVNFTLGVNVEKLYLNGGATTGTGNALDNYISGNGNNDILSGVAGNDTLDGSFGNDKLDGGVGDDSLDGGVGNDTLLGGAGNDILEGKAGNDKMDGGAGNDTYIDVEAGDTVTDTGGGIDLLKTSVSLIGDLGAGIDNLTLEGTGDISGRGNVLNNIIIGNDGNNLLEGLAGNDSISGFAGVDILLGGDGNDTLNGGVGADLMNGGNGNDTYFVDEIGDAVVETSTAVSVDSVFSSVDFLLGANIENLTLTGSGSINGTGNNIANIITGNSGANVLTGLGGNDTYIVGLGDTAVEAVGEGTDLVKSSVTFTLGANIENLTLTDSGNIDGTGNALNNLIIGNSGNNILDGGTGNDTMQGGAGDDTYFVDSFVDSKHMDVVTEAANAGTDTVNSSINFTLGANVENLTLTGAAINGTGNTLNNYIIGNTGNNSLNGGTAGNDTLDGGAGADNMNGGTGNDTYYVDNTSDVIIDSTGIDNVYSSVTFALGATLENLTLYGVGNINGTGNALANILTGNSGVNVLTGLGGNDIYIVGLGDSVVEAASQGTDLVKSSVTYTLDSNVENLTLIGSGDINATGNNLDNIITGNSGNNILTGLGGNDTYIVDSLTDTVVEALDEGTDTVKSSVNYTLGNNVENLTLIGSANNGTGNALNNLIIGNSGNNILDGGVGADTMIGGLGGDTYYVDNSDDVVTETTGGGATNAVYSSVSWTLAANFFEKLQLTGAGAINGTGNTQNNRIYGNSGNNVLSGMNGNDELKGDGGDDTLDGGNGNDSLYGGIGTDSLIGGAGNDVLDGGADADAMAGGAGNDAYYVDNLGDVITEGVNAGTDTVYSTITFDLTDPTNANLENITLYGSNDIDATGNSGANVLIGNSGANTLTGHGGNDTYIVGLGDVVVEAADEGTDIVKSSVTFSLTGSAEGVENLTLTGSGSIDGTGNDRANTIIGNDGDNTLSGDGGNDTLDGGLGDDFLDGGAGNDSLTGGAGNDNLQGGAGNDTMTGGAGDDTYLVDSALDKVIEAAGGGIDKVESSLLNYTLGANVENLSLTGGNDNLNGTGNTLNNLIEGNDGNNVLKGGAGNDTLDGGPGNDTLTGDAGNDLFVFDKFNFDPNTVTEVTDFTSGTDLIGLRNFSGLDFDGAGGSLNAGQFHLGTEAGDINDFIIFDAAAKNLYYDADGSDNVFDAVLIAHFSNSVAATDIFQAT